MRKKCAADVFTFKKVKTAPDAFPAGQNHFSQFQSGRGASEAQLMLDICDCEWSTTLSRSVSKSSLWTLYDMIREINPKD